MAPCYITNAMKTTPRIFLDAALSGGAELPLPRDQGHYLTGVLRLKPGDAVRAFNARDGEWLAYLADAGRKSASLRIERKTADARPPPDIDYLFAPIKHARLDLMVQKAVELGARRLRPVITKRTIAERVNLARMRANAVEAAEQCNLVFVPDVIEPEKLDAALSRWDPGRALVYCDETLATVNALDGLAGLQTPAAVLIGPEGGFTAEEKQLLSGLPFVRAISLGPRIMRADTAAIAALTLVQAVAGDWS
jgi:16S rRNA (uracil1498-N3)-methyltransferase